jgi:uncharacterized protein (TIGR02271 family)
MPTEPDDIVVPLHEEAISVEKKRTATGRLRISTVTHQRDVPIDEVLTQENIEVERISINKPVDRVPSVREEGDTLIIPVVEENLVVERRLILKEEVRVRRIRTTERHHEHVTVRKQEAVITRIPIGTGKNDGSAA